MMEAYSIKDKSLPIYGIEKDNTISKEKGCLSYGFVVQYPALYNKDINDYEVMANVTENLFNILEENYIVHKQEFFLSETYHPEKRKNESDMQRYNRIHFTGRKVRRQYSYIYITKVPENYINFTSKETNTFLYKEKASFFKPTIDRSYISPAEIELFFKKKQRVSKLLKNKYFKAIDLKSEDYLAEKKGLFDLFKNFDFSGLQRDKSFEENKCFIGDKKVKFYTLQKLEDLTDTIAEVCEAKEKQGSGLQLFKSNTTELGLQLDHDHVLNQYFYLPNADKVFKKLNKKQNRLNNFAYHFQPKVSGTKKEGAVDNMDSQANKIYASKLNEFKEEVLSSNQKVVYTHLNVGIIEGELDTSEYFKLNLKENIADRVDLYFACCPGNAIGLPADLYMELSEKAAISLAYFEDYSKGNAPFGVRMVDIISGAPIYWSVFNEPYRKELITNRNGWAVGKTGSGKSFSMNTVFSHEYYLGNHIFNIDGSSSFERTTKFHNGFYFKISKGSKIGLNPFVLSRNDDVEIADKRTFLANFMLNLIDEYANSLTLSLFTDVLDSYYKTVKENHCFNSFYEHFKKTAPAILKENGIARQIPLSSIIYLLKIYYKGGAYDYLLNSRDKRLKDLVFNRYITFQIKELKDDPKLFTITTFLLTNLYKEKLYHPDLLNVVKYLHYDESWTAMDKPILVEFIKDTIKTVRSQNGGTFFSSQDVEDFFSSEVIKKAVINNSDLGIVCDLSGYKGDPLYIKKILSLTDNQLNRIFSLNRNKPKDYKLREIAFIYDKKHLITLGNEVSLEEKSIYESNPYEKTELKKMDQQNLNSLHITAKQYAGN